MDGGVGDDMNKDMLEQAQWQLETPGQQFWLKVMYSMTCLTARSVW